MQRSTTTFASGIVAMLMMACADTTPLPYEAPIADAGVTETGVPAEVIAACRACIVDDGAPCRAAYDQCTEETKCRPFMHCVLDAGCIAEGELQNRITCAQPCFTKFGIAAGVDPALQEGLALNVCTLGTGPCAAACGAD